jgi:hypothetical protein
VISSTTADTLKAMAVLNVVGYTPSGVMTEIYTPYTIQVDSVVANPPGREYWGTDSVTLSTTTPGAEIWYCIDCTEDPSPNGPNSFLYTPGEKIYISDQGSTTLKAIAVRNEIGYDPSPVMVETYTNKDWEGPTIEQALYYLGTAPGKTPTGNPDTLVITFSELVLCSDLTDPQSVFNYFHGTADVTAEVFENARFLPGSGTTTDEVTIILEAVGRVIPIDDSLCIEEGRLSDQYGNPAPQCQRAVVRWGRNYDWAFTVSPVPFKPGDPDYRIPDPIYQKIDYTMYNQPAPPHSAALVQITSIKRVDVERSKADVYDATGNIVREGLPVYPSSDDRSTFYLAWDGLNRNGRIVGSGTYIAFMHIREIGESKTSVRQQKIGIRN